PVERLLTLVPARPLAQPAPRLQHAFDLGHALPRRFAARESPQPEGFVKGVGVAARTSGLGTRTYAGPPERGGFRDRVGGGLDRPSRAPKPPRAVYWAAKDSVARASGISCSAWRNSPSVARRISPSRRQARCRNSLFE